MEAPNLDRHASDANKVRAPTCWPGSPWECFEWNESLQIASAHRLVTSLEQFRQLVSMIDKHADLSAQVKRIRWQHGAEEIQLLNGSRFIIKAGGSAARGASPTAVHHG
jgi:hypothetical protein